MPVRITFTSGFEVTGQGRKWGVRKSLLVSTLDAKLHTGELRFSNELLTAEAVTNCKIFRSTCHRRADVVGNKAANYLVERHGMQATPPPSKI